MSKQFTTVTDRQGLYEFADLADGQWKIEIEMSGFSKLDGKVTVAPETPQGNWELKLLGLDKLLAAAQESKPLKTRPAAEAEAGCQPGNAEDRARRMLPQPPPPPDDSPRSPRMAC